MYKNSFQNAELIKGKGYALREAFRVWIQLFGKPRRYEVVRDSVGKVAYKIGNIVLAAKHSQDGDVISAHKFLWDYCLKNKKRLVIYMKDSGYFYRFEPENIKEFKENERGEQKMINFSILNGRNIIKLKAEKIKIKNVAEKNMNYGLKEMFRLGVFG